ncbi:hypothetical protein FN846DRAFT_991026 [Sphaerosporella brunnea]|uniref:Uncharacterized protein n=1 Tax=Sphaerosporella brunnea TaxID=1250544 RepID=A0A5J5EN81_9PEZI|nr:hypothetical protein FN846DRAFT_991026 [Sphaerosporella brunnea]
MYQTHLCYHVCSSPRCSHKEDDMLFSSNSGGFVSTEVSSSSESVVEDSSSQSEYVVEDQNDRPSPGSSFGGRRVYPDSEYVETDYASSSDYENWEDDADSAADETKSADSEGERWRAYLIAEFKRLGWVQDIDPSTGQVKTGEGENGEGENGEGENGEGENGEGEKRDDGRWEEDACGDPVTPTQPEFKVQVIENAINTKTTQTQRFPRPHEEPCQDEKQVQQPENPQTSVAHEKLHVQVTVSNFASTIVATPALHSPRRTPDPAYPDIERLSADTENNVHLFYVSKANLC